MKITLDTKDFRLHGLNGAAALAVFRAMPDATVEEWGKVMSLSKVRVRNWIEYLEYAGVLERQMNPLPNRGARMIVGVKFK